MTGLEITVILVASHLAAFVGGIFAHHWIALRAMAAQNVAATQLSRLAGQMGTGTKA